MGKISKQRETAIREQLARGASVERVARDSRTAKSVIRRIRDSMEPGPGPIGTAPVSGRTGSEPAASPPQERRTPMAEQDSVPKWSVELDRLRGEHERSREKLGDQLQGLQLTLKTLTDALGAIGTEVKGVTALKGELKSLCDLYPDLCKLVEQQKKAPTAPTSPKGGSPAPAPAYEAMSMAQAIEALKHWTTCPECVEKLRPQLEQDPALLEGFLTAYRPQPKEAPHERRGFLD